MNVQWRGSGWVASCLGVAALMLAAGMPASRAQVVRYVDGAVTGPGPFDGTSWANAYTNLAGALAASGSGTNLWVARGTYRDAASFQLKSGVNLYGGFTNGMANFAARDWTAHAVLLDGQAARTVLQGANNAVLDGFVITNGAAVSGGGMYNNAVAPALANCTFVNNTAGGGGGAIYNFGEAADVAVSNCVFLANTAATGGAIHTYLGDPTIRNSQFLRNRTTGAGGAIYNQDFVLLTLADCSLVSNRAASVAGVIYNSPSGNALTIDRCVFEANQADQNAGVAYCYNVVLALRGSRFVGNVANTAGVIWNDQSSRGYIEDCLFAGNQATNGVGGVYYGNTGNGALTNRNCVFVGNSATSPTPGEFSGGGGVASGLGDNSVYEACVFSANRAAGSGGVFGKAHFDGDPAWQFRRSTFAGNESALSGGVLYGVAGLGPRFENCVIGGNVAANGGALALRSETAAGLRVFHCTFNANRATTSGGALLTGSVSAYVTNCIFWGNAAGVSGGQIHQQTANRAIVGHSVVQDGWAGLGTNNLALDPAFRGATAGTWTAVSSYDPVGGQTALTDSGAAWTAGDYAGRTFNPDTNQWLQFVVASNTVNTLYVWGNARTNRAGGAVADVGDAYRIDDLRLQATSPVVDAGRDVGVTNDFAGAVRPREAAPEPGAYEVQEDLTAPAAIANLLAAPLHLRVELSWTPPPTHDLTGVLAVRRSGAAPTAVPAAGQVYTNGETLGDGVVVHTALATGWSDSPLVAGTDYHYRLFAFDDVANYSSGVGTSATPVDDTSAPAALTDLTAAGVTGAVRLAWTNPLDGDFGGVLVVRRQGTAPTGAPTTGAVYTPGQAFGGGMVIAYGAAEAAAPGAANGFTDGGLADATAYHYAVFPYDLSRNYAAAAFTAATTAADVVPPADVTGLAVASDDGWIQLAWTNPVDPDFTGVLILRRAGGAPTGVPATATSYTVGEMLGDGQVVFTGLASGWRDTDVTNGMAYHYVVYARDEVPNYSAGVGGSETPVVRNVQYVDWEATGANNGSSWTDAFTNLAVALAAAGSGTNLWVAEGTYRPGVSRDASFVLKAGVGVLGGFTNGMSTINQRNWNAHVTTLSGDLNANGQPDFADVYHVVTATWATNAVLDGVTVTCGYAHNPISDTDAFRNGGGLYLWNSDVTPAIRNCRFINNSANYQGGAVVIRHLTRGATGVLFSNCVFRGNATFRNGDGHGGAIYHLYRPLIVVDSILEDNASTLTGGAIESIAGDPILRRSTFARNVATNAGNSGRGGAIYHDRSDLTAIVPAEISDCRFYANRASTYGAGDYRRAGYTNDAIRGCDFFANETTTGAGGGLFLFGYNSVIENCRFSGNVINGGNVHAGALYLYDSDAILRSVVLAGNVAPGYGGGLWADNGSRPRFENALVAGNQARYGGGGLALYDALDGTNTLINCTVVDNRTTEPNTGYGGGGLFLRNGLALVTNTIFHGNRTAGTGAHVRVELAGDIAHYGYSLLDGGMAGTFAVAGATNVDAGSNLNSEPLFRPELTGAWTAAASYTNASGLTVLTDATAVWTPGKLAGLLLNPNTNAGVLAYVIATNTATTVSIMGMATNAGIGAAYRILNHRLQNVSPCIDSGLAGVAPTGDLAGLARPQGAGVDRGAYERVREAAAPEPVAGLTATGGMDQVALAWMNPTNADFAGVLIVRRQGGPPTGVPVWTNEYAPGAALGDGVVVYAGWGSDGGPGAASSWVHTGVPAEQTFHYVVFAHDGVPNYAAGAGASATTLQDPVAPGPVSGARFSDSGPWLTLAWTNPPDADFSEVLIVRREGAAPTGIPVWTNRYAAGTNLGDGVVVYQGPGSSAAPGAGAFWTDTGVAPSVVYYYAIHAADEVPNYASGVTVRASSRMPGVLFVNGAASGLQDGRTWADAFTSLHTALAQSTTNDTLWVAAGTYAPGPFQLRTNVAVYGGFQTGMSTLGARNWVAHPTVLSGGGPVVHGADGARLDGFTVTGGNGVSGGGFFQSGGRVTVANCNVVSNQAQFGGGLYFTGVQALVDRCRVAANTATGGGGGIYAQSMTLIPAGTIQNCVILGNRSEGSSGSDGGGIFLFNCPYRIESCTIANNFTARRGGGVKMNVGTVEHYIIRNCILWNNQTSESDPTPGFRNGGWEVAVQQDNTTPPLVLEMSYTDWTPVGSWKFYWFYRDGINKEVFTNLMEQDPAFANPAAGDLHEKSWAGRWLNGGWTFDQTNSPCIDAGDPTSAFSLESPSNGGRINMGAYGNTPEASRSGAPQHQNGFLLYVR